MQKVRGKVQQFPQPNGWFFVPIEKKTLPKNIPKNRWGFTPIIATIHKTSWKTSLLPLDKDFVFIAIKKDIRKRENISLYDTINITWDYYK